MVPGAKLWVFYAFERILSCDVSGWLQVMYFTATSPYIIMCILLIRGVTLPGALEGIKFYLVPDWTKIAQPQVRLHNLSVYDVTVVCSRLVSSHRCGSTQARRSSSLTRSVSARSPLSAASTSSTTTAGGNSVTSLTHSATLFAASLRNRCTTYLQSRLVYISLTCRGERVSILLPSAAVFLT